MRGGSQVGRSAQYDPLSQGLSDDEDEKSGIIVTSSSSVFEQKNLSGESCCTSTGNVSKTSMSRLRKLAFVLSLVFACVMVASFLWLLPCEDEYAVCATSNEGKTLSNWTRVFSNLVFTSGLDFVDVNGDGNFDVLISFHSFRGLNHSIPSPPVNAGLMMLNGKDGQAIWRQSQYSISTYISCTKLDVNGDGIDDCIIVGDREPFLSAINASNNYTFWYFHDHVSFRRPVWISTPIVIPDVNNDGVDDLLMSCRFINEEGSRLAFVSGSMGELLGRPLSIPRCSFSSSPVSLAARDLSVYIILSCDSENQTSSVVIQSLSHLAHFILGSDRSTSLNSFREIYTFTGGKSACLLALDLDLHSDGSILVAGGDGEVAVIDSNINSVTWTHQRSNHTILNCETKKIKINHDTAEETKVVLITYSPHKSQFTSLVECISLINGSVLWSFSDSSILSPVSTLSDNIIAFKSISRINSLNQSLSVSLGDENTVTELFSISEVILFFSSTGQITRSIQVSNSSISICSYDYDGEVFECLPNSLSLPTSFVVCEKTLTIYSVSPSVVYIQGNWNIQTTVIKSKTLSTCDD